MAVYFLDTSALVKRYASEPGHSWVTLLCDPGQEHNLFISQAAIVEVVAALCAKARYGAITLDERDLLITAFRQDDQRDYYVRPVTEAIYIAAGELCRSHKLRAYDAVQMACALAIRDDALANDANPPTFVCADRDLLAVASVEGLSVENPNDYA